MRIRQVRPEFWSDDKMGALDDPVRLFYIGLWTVADDAGYLEWNPALIGAKLYPYRDAATRVDQIVAWATELVQANRLVLLDCGCGVVPTLVDHQKMAGKRSYFRRDEHRGHMRPMTGSTSLESDLPGNGNGNGNGNEGTMTGSTPPEWQELGPRLQAIGATPTKTERPRRAH